jgi:HPt (histidine-containing phosphotransfer) domain-containing protein
VNEITHVDAALFAQLVESTGQDPGFLRSLVSVYVTDTDQGLQAFRAALRTGDTAGARRHAHSMKSSSMSFGARTLAAQCRELEELAKAGGGGID